MKAFQATVAVLLFLLGACTTTAVLTGGIANPVTPARALTLRATFDGGVVVAAGDYAALARCPAPAPCSDQKVVNQLRVYVNGADGVLTQLQAWALGNASLNGADLYTAAITAVTDAQSYASSNGLKFTPATSGG